MPATPPRAPALTPPAVRRLDIKAIPTGSLAPDSPSRIVPLRPATSRLPSTEKTTAGSVGRDGGRRAAARPTTTSRRHVREHGCGDGGEEGAGEAGQQDRGGGAAHPAHAEVQAAVEQDQDEGDGDEALDRALRQVVQARRQRGGDRCGGEEQCGGRQPEPLAQPVGQDGGQADAREGENDPPEGGRVLHRLPGRVTRLTVPERCRCEPAPAGAVSAA